MKYVSMVALAHDLCKIICLQARVRRRKGGLRASKRSAFQASLGTTEGTVPFSTGCYPTNNFVTLARLAGRQVLALCPHDLLFLGVHSIFRSSRMAMLADAMSTSSEWWYRHRKSGCVRSLMHSKKCPWWLARRLSIVELGREHLRGSGLLLSSSTLLAV